MSQLRDIEKRLIDIETRNARVELDKQWETSWTRRLCIGLLTYVVTLLFLLLLPTQRPAVNALVAVVGYILSNLAVGSMREIWEAQQRRNGQ